MSVTLKDRYRPADAKGHRALKGWYVVFYDANRSPREREVPTGTKDARLAAARKAEAERAFVHGTYDPWRDRNPPWAARAGSGLTVVEAVERFLADRASGASGRACTPKTVQSYREHLRPLLATLPAGLMLADLSPAHVERYRRAAWPTIREATRETYARSFRVFVEWCRRPAREGGAGLVTADWTPEPPTRASGRASSVASDDAPKYFTPEDVARLVATARARAAAPATHGERTHARPGGEPVRAVLPDVVLFAAFTGLRRGEVCALTWADFMRDGGGGEYVRVVSGERHRTKTGRSRTVPLHGPAVEAIQRRRGAASTGGGASAPVFPGAHGGPMNPEHLAKHFRALVREAFPQPDGAPPDRRSFHSLRHTFGTSAVGLGVDVYAVRDAMGHASVEVTQRYAKFQPVALHRSFLPFASAAEEGRDRAPGRLSLARRGRGRAGQR